MTARIPFREIQVNLEDVPELLSDSQREQRQSNMASASSTSAKSLFADSKSRLADRVQNNVNNIASLARQIQRGSKTNEIIMTSARNFVAQEQTIANTESNLKKTAQLMDRMNYDHLSVVKSATAITEAVQVTAAMQR